MLNYKTAFDSCLGLARDFLPQSINAPNQTSFHKSCSLFACCSSLKVFLFFPGPAIDVITNILIRSMGPVSEELMVRPRLCLTQNSSFVHKNRNILKFHPSFPLVTQLDIRRRPVEISSDRVWNLYSFWTVMTNTLFIYLCICWYWDCWQGAIDLCSLC